jgi:hypothetical protein
MDENEKKYIDDTREYWAGFPEAPCSDSFKWIDSTGYEHMLTIRAYSPQLLFRQIEKVVSGLADIGGKPIGKPVSAPAPKPDPAAKIAAEEGNYDMAAQLQAEADDIGLPPDGKEWHTSDCVFVKVLPQPDDKVTVEFYGNDKKQPHNDYASVKVNKWSVPNATGLMKYVTSADMSKAAEFTLSCRVYWTEGKEYTGTNGNKGHYKDVAHVRPI